MKAEFSEFSYGFALSYEIMNALAPDVVGAPLFPSLVSEGELGFDVSFAPVGWPLFLQFKLADYLITTRARFWHYYGEPFYRVAIRRLADSNQHNLLRALATSEPEVYYAAPAFHRQTDFNGAFRSNRIFMRSVYLPLGELPALADNDQHYVTYREGENACRWHSEGDRYFGVAITGRDWLNRLQRRAREPRKLGERFFSELRVRLVGMIRDHTLQPSLLDELPVDLEDSSPLAIFRDLRFLLVTFFGVEAIILRPRQSK